MCDLFSVPILASGFSVTGLDPGCETEVPLRVSGSCPRCGSRCGARFGRRRTRPSRQRLPRRGAYMMDERSLCVRLAFEGPRCCVGCVVRVSDTDLRCGFRGGVRCGWRQTAAPACPCLSSYGEFSCGLSASPPPPWCRSLRSRVGRLRRDVLRTFSPAVFACPFPGAPVWG